MPTTTTTSEDNERRRATSDDGDYRSQLFPPRSTHARSHKCATVLRVCKNHLWFVVISVCAFQCVSRCVYLVLPVCYVYIYNKLYGWDKTIFAVDESYQQIYILRSFRLFFFVKKRLHISSWPLLATTLDHLSDSIRIPFQFCTSS